MGLGLGALASCAPEAPPEQPAPEQPPDRPPLPDAEPPAVRPAESDEPRVRIGLAVGVPSVTIGSDNVDPTPAAAVARANSCQRSSSPLSPWL